MANTAEELHILIGRLSPAEQRQVLEYAQKLSQISQLLSSIPHTPLPPGKPASDLLGLDIPLENAQEMEQALVDCERIDIDEY